MVKMVFSLEIGVWDFNGLQRGGIIIKQISVFLENKAGRLVDATRILGDKITSTSGHSR